MCCFGSPLFFDVTTTLSATEKQVSVAVMNCQTGANVGTFHDGCKQGIDQQIFNRKSISRKITHPQSWKLQAKLTGEMLKG